LPNKITISSKYKGEIKTIHDKQKLQQLVATKPALKKIFKEILHREKKKNI
jgi:hypothetical protein